MFFNSRKYSEETEKNRVKNDQDPSMFNMVSLGLLATFAPTRFLLQLLPARIDDSARKNLKLQKQTPIILVHGFRGGDYTTQKLVDSFLTATKQTGYLKVVLDLSGKVKISGEWTASPYPVIQLVFRQRIVGIRAINFYLKQALKILGRQYHFSEYYAVGHSLGAVSVIENQMNLANKPLPQMKKAALIAGPFDGVTYLGDIPNVNAMGEKGYPVAQNLTFLRLNRKKKRFASDIKVLNIYGNVLDETNTDKFISVVSAKSVRYILAPIVSYFQEVEVRGKGAEHSELHDDPFVINIIEQFFGVK